MDAWMDMKMSCPKFETDCNGVLNPGKGLLILELNRLSNRPDHHRVYILNLVRAPFFCHPVILKNPYQR